MKQNIQLIISTLVLTIFVSCNNSKTTKNYKLTSNEKRMCDSLQIDTTIILDIRTYNTHKIEPFHYSLSKMYKDGIKTESDPMRLNGLVFGEQNYKSYDLVFNLKDGFKKKGYSVFMVENNFNINQELDCIGVLKTTDKYSVLKQIGTDGINYDIDNDSLIAIIKQFDKKHSLELVGASGDWCDFIIINEPKNWTEFAKEVYKVCPDVVDQGTGTIDALANEMKQTKRLYFWWD